MRLSEFIRRHTEELCTTWDEYAQTLLPAAAGMDNLALRDHCYELLRAIADDLERPQTAVEAQAKSRGLKDSKNVISTVPADVHAKLRYTSGFTIIQLAAEYRALRASVARLWRLERHLLTDADIGDLERFNEAVDEALAISIARYSALVDDTREVFLAILGHDLRAPLNAITMTADRLRSERTPDVDRAAARILHSGLAIDNMVAELLDFVRSRLSTQGAPPFRNVDMKTICESSISICQAAYPGVEVHFECTGPELAEADPGRMEQLLRNLISNAIEHGEPATAVTVSLEGGLESLRIAVTDTGPPIPTEAVQVLLDPLRRAAIRQPDGTAHIGRPGLGLGLFIVREIVQAHFGQIRIEAQGSCTTVVVEVPRRQPSN